MKPALALLALALAGCSATVLPQVPCASHAACRDAFGRGWTCGDAGLCGQSEPHPRCSSTPEGILTSLEDHEDRLLLASLFDQSDFGLMVHAARLAVQQVNDHNGLDGRPFGIIECTNEADASIDSLDENEATAEVAAWVADALGVPALVGPATSTRTEIAYNTLSPRDVVLISPSATSPGLTYLDGATADDASPGLLWRTAPPDALQGEVIAREMRANLSADRAAVILQRGAYGEGLAAVFTEVFTDLGGAVEQYPFSTLTELSETIEAVDTANLDEVLVISSSTSDVVAFLNAIGPDPAWDGVGIFLTDGARDSQVFEETSAAARALFPRVRGTVPKTPTGRQAYQTFATNYRAVFGPENPDSFGFTAHAYDASWLAIYGTAWALANEDSLRGTTVARGLRRVSSGTQIEVRPDQWNVVKGFFQDGRSVDIDGASGNLDFDPTTEETTSPIDVWTIVDRPQNDPPYAFEAIYCWDVSNRPDPSCTGGP